MCVCVCVSEILTIQAVDTHHQVDPVVKLLIVFLGGEIRKIGGQERKVAIATGLEAQLLQQLLFGFVEPGGRKSVCEKSVCESRLGAREQLQLS